MARRTAFLLCLSFLASLQAHAGGAGTSAASSLAIPAGARAAALGGAYTAVAEGAESLSWNPAGLARLEKRSATFMHSTYLDGGAMDYAAYGQRLKGFSLGTALFRYDAGSIDRLDALGDKVGSIAPGDMSLAVGAAGLWKSLAGGASLKYVRSKVVDSAHAVALDLGVHGAGLWGGKAAWGASASNLGGKLKYGSSSEDLPRVFRAGLSARPVPGWTAALDVAAPKGADAYVALGAEYLPAFNNDWPLALRAGYSTEHKDVEGFSDLTFGLGFGRPSFRLDYALVPFGDLGLTHRISLSTDF